MPVDLMSVYPHAHYLGKEMRSRRDARRHDEDAAAHPAVELPLAAGLPLRHADSAPGGTTLTMKYTYDNSDGNDENPHHRRSACGSGRNPPTRWPSSDCRCCRSRSPTPRRSCRLSTITTRWRTSRSARCACANRRTAPNTGVPRARATRRRPVRRRDSAPRGGDAPRRHVRRRARRSRHGADGAGPAAEARARTFSAPSRSRRATRRCTSTSATRSARASRPPTRRRRTSVRSRSIRTSRTRT